MHSDAEHLAFANTKSPIEKEERSDNCAHTVSYIQQLLEWHYPPLCFSAVTSERTSELQSCLLHRPAAYAVKLVSS